MSNIIFCSNCSNPIDYDQRICQCGFEMPQTEKREIIDQLTSISNNYLIDPELEELANLSHQELYDNYLLDSIYFSSTSAKRDYDKKVNFLRSNLLPRINNWSEAIEAAQKTVAIDKVEVYQSVIFITDFILKEFFGPFKVKENGLESFVAIRDFGTNKLSETIIGADLDFSDIKTVNFSSIGSDIFNSVGKTLTEGSFKELSKKSEWSESDIKTLKREVGIAVAGQVLAGVGNMISQTQAAIQNVRVADSNLNEKLEGISKAIQSLSIEERETEKQKRLFSRNKLLLSYCFETVLNPVVEQINNNPDYQKYKEARKPFDIEQEIIKLDKESLNVKLKVSFWSCLLRSESQNFRSNKKKRLKKTGDLRRYKELTKYLGIKPHSSLEGSRAFESWKTKEFEDFEDINRRILYKIPVFKENTQRVKKFAAVFKTIKSNIISQNHEIERTYSE